MRNEVHYEPSWKRLGRHCSEHHTRSQVHHFVRLINRTLHAADRCEGGGVKERWFNWPLSLTSWGWQHNPNSMYIFVKPAETLSCVCPSLPLVLFSSLEMGLLWSVLPGRRQMNWVRYRKFSATEFCSQEVRNLPQTWAR
jgi:hypothetical protein